MIGALIKPVYRLYEWSLEGDVKKHRIPKHIAIIMDGNRRLAERLGLKPWEGHRMGADKVEDVLEWCIDVGIETITVYAFSTENFSRPKEELEKLFDIFEEYFGKIARDKRIHKNRVKVKAIGKIERFPDRVREAIKHAEEVTKDYDVLQFNLAMAYGGRAEVLDALKKIAGDVKSGKIELEAITESTISENLYTNGLPDPDLIIRTSGEERISGFLLWQSAYSELYFCESYWPGFRKIDFLRAIRTFQERKRRFGK
ncbi:di-trans,poly-cis-decaprenylcistransferase [archaeon]|nr:di-trans,poly-cis-decaprenylcistransferase [archaeon]